MTIAELRIGDLISHKDEVIEVQSINRYTAQVNFGVLYDDGIAITESWLLEFGFEKWRLIDAFGLKCDSDNSLEIDLNNGDVYLCGYDSVTNGQSFF